MDPVEITGTTVRKDLTEIKVAMEIATTEVMEIMGTTVLKDLTEIATAKVEVTETTVRKEEDIVPTKEEDIILMTSTTYKNN